MASMHTSVKLLVPGVVLPTLYHQPRCLLETTTAIAGNAIVALNPAAFWQQQQLLHANPLVAMNLVVFWQQQLLLPPVLL
jgi:hypothetical protein